MNEVELDRLCELTNIGAGHAADAFARLVGRPVWIRVPRMREADHQVWTDLQSASSSPDAWSTGVFFELEGSLDALVGILFRASASEAVVRRVVGEAEGPLPPHAIESALMEVGNILASHVASAIADTLGVRLLPSIPMLAMKHAEEVLASLVGTRGGAHPARIECELCDEDGELGGLVVLVPRERESASAPS